MFVSKVWLLKYFISSKLYYKSKVKIYTYTVDFICVLSILRTQLLVNDF